MRTYACYRYGRGFTGETHGLGECPSLGKGHDQRPVEHIARGGRVDGLCLVCRDDFAVCTVEDQGPFGTERDDDVAHTHRRDFTGGFFGRAFIGDADSGDGFGFGFIRGDRVERFEQSGGELRGRGRVQDDLLAQPVRHPGGGLDGLHRDFELQQDDVGRFDCLGRPFQVVGGEMRVGAGSDDDAVLSVGIHGNQGHARRVFRVGKYIRGVDPLFVEQLVGLVPEDVAACFADEGDPSAQTRHGDGLVGAFAARVHEEGAPDDRLAGKG